MDEIRDIVRSLLVWLGITEKPDFYVRVVADHPLQAEMAPGIMYVVGGLGYQKWAYFLCPSDTGELIQLSLQTNHRPRWTVSRDILGRPTVHPSVRQTAGSYAHFWIKKGHVVWCEDSGRRPSFSHLA